MAKIAVIYYSAYGHTFDLAKAIEKGAKEAGAETRLRKVRELVPEETIKSNKGLSYGSGLQKDLQEAALEDLLWADGIAFGTPTRFGNTTAQLRNFLDQTGPLWAKGALAGKVASFFTSASTPHGGHETTILTLSTFAYHHGMLIMPMGYTISGSVDPYGPTYVSGDGSKPVGEEEKRLAYEFGKGLAKVAQRLAGK
ncbi:MAG: NAD(P)H:quinone oxidoreductase [Deltaproteobacteria bacterium]|nr:NAD(P)H:quinone oxidoreductase [Deltaproteobacteria bacterium]MCL5276241.1 NAD(P)H:quinone oxidoreductase [Deltaproteobacteria bacterium]